MQEYYARRATEYERVYAKTERQADLGMLRGLLVEAFSGKQVLDLSCGTGYWTSVFAPVARKVVACDINEEVLEIARQKPWGSADVSFLRADSYRLPEFAIKFDAAFAGFWWSHVPRSKWREFLSGLHSRLEHGAKVVFIDNRFVEGSNTPISRTDACGDTYQERRLSDGTVYEVLKNFPTAEELLRAVTDVSERAQVRETQYFWVLTYYVR